jgi:hypothetical protein
MQKVVGSNPIIRFTKSLAGARLLLFQVVVGGDTIGASQVPGQVRGSAVSAHWLG